MKTYLDALTERNFQNRKIAFIENGSWVPNAMKVMQKHLEGCKDLTYAQNNVTILSALNDQTRAQIVALAEELA